MPLLRPPIRRPPPASASAARPSADAHLRQRVQAARSARCARRIRSKRCGMSLVRRLEEIDASVGALECPHCTTRFVRAEWADLGDPLTCDGCGVSGLIPRRARVADRFPEGIGSRFTPIPEALMDHAEELGFGARELLVVWALERHRRSGGELVFPSVARLASLTQLSERTVKRSLQQLVALGHVGRARARWRGTSRLASNRYDLAPLWQRVADAEHAAAAAGLAVPRATGHSRREPQDSVTREVDAVQRDACLERETPDGARACARGVRAGSEGAR